jgi:uncharacterized membrane protein
MKYLCLFFIGGFIYYFIEIIWRGYSHWSMFILGGICFIVLGNINNILSWETPLIYQSILGSIIITILEYITGYIVNIKLNWDVWDYSDLPLNIDGQVCLLFSLIWLIISTIGIILDDYLRYFIFKEKKPVYKLFK